MKKNYKNRLLILGLLCCLNAEAQNNFFTDIKETSFKTLTEERVIVPQKYRTISLDTASLYSFLRTVPLRKNIKDENSLPILTLPMPNGTTAHFNIWETSVMELALAAKYPNIKTYTGKGIEDVTATIKISWTELGFRAMILTANSSAIFIDPYTQSSKVNYIAYYRSDYKKSGGFKEIDIPQPISQTPYLRPAGVLGTSVGTQLLTFRWAIACTHQYAIAATGLSSPTVAQTLAAIVVTVARVNAVYENELSISLILANNENQIIYTSSANDPLGQYNANPSLAMFNAGQNVMNSNIGVANYDVGEIFTTGAGGASYVGVVCQDNMKSFSAVGIQHPVGDAFNIDYVCHEVGHEFGAHHPFNSDKGACIVQGQIYLGTNDEPGSGSTIVGYSSNATDDGYVLCNADNLQANSDPYFNTLNFDEIINYTNGTSCASVTATVNRTNSGPNHAPVVSTPADYIIPLSTPFILKGDATDQDGDSLTYCWEQVDVGADPCGWNNPSGDAPIFRSFSPVKVPYRYFPKLSDVINNTTTIGELKPTYARNLHFRLTARDNRPNGGGVGYSGNTVIVDGSSGPFIVTYPNASGITWSTGEFRTVTWNPAGTQNAPVSCSNVMVLLSRDGGLTYPDTLVASTPNTGSVAVQVPNNSTTTARILVMGLGNVFYDISNTNFSIIDSTVPITWISFIAAKRTDNTGLLTWTVNEQNVKYYIVQRRTDSTDFKALGTVSSIKGNSSNQLYSFVDASPFQGNNYYRIEEVNGNGSFTYSPVENLSFTDVATPWTIFPNPASSILNVQSNASNAKGMIQLFDAAGRLMYQQAYPATQPGQLIPVSVSKFAKGVYVVKITSTTGVKELPLLIH